MLNSAIYLYTRNVYLILNYWKLDTGYMLSFNFNRNKNPGVFRVPIGGKILFEGTV